MRFYIPALLLMLSLCAGCYYSRQTHSSTSTVETRGVVEVARQKRTDQADVAHRCVVSKEDVLGGGFILDPGNATCVVRVKNADPSASIRSLRGLVCFAPGENNEVTSITVKRVPKIARLLGGEISIADGFKFSIKALDVEPGVTMDLFVELATTPRKGYAVVFEVEYDG